VRWSESSDPHHFDLTLLTNPVIQTCKIDMVPVNISQVFQIILASAKVICLEKHAT